MTWKQFIYSDYNIGNQFFEDQVGEYYLVAHKDGYVHIDDTNTYLESIELVQSTDYWSL